ncbi:Bestrophin-2 [Holothuria leucospilota]|uniref:Bestrophin homolog n=1 Tax=Holothuria leucospilota TaxID=206669 RepID=A0A9Q1CFI1_HOLLE|nr:Bestrophin-2 [Holothuria leucospilota]
MPIARLQKFKLGGFARLLFCWKASVYKLLWREVLIFLLIYTVISLVYRVVLPNYPNVRENFELVAIYSYDYTAVFPISFVLGFYVTVVFDRWWMQFKAIPWPDRVVNNISAHLNGADERGRLLRRALARYVNLSAILIYRLCSKRVKKRFPTFQHLVEAGVMTSKEKDIIKKLPTDNPKYWVPCTWFVNLVREIRKEGRIESDPAMKTIIDELNNFLNKCDELYGFDWIIVPLVYTQVVTIATYSYFLACTVGRQYLDPSKNYTGHSFDLFFPGFTVLEFVFYVGWLKVAENLMNPFGEDDDDFDMNWIVDRNLEVSFLAVDEMYDTKIPVEPDPHIDVSNIDMPYTNASIKKKGKPWQGSASKVRLSRKDMVFTSMPGKIFTEEDEIISSGLLSKSNNYNHCKDPEKQNPPPYSENEINLTENRLNEPDKQANTPPSNQSLWDRQNSPPKRLSHSTQARRRSPKRHGRRDSRSSTKNENGAPSSNQGGNSSCANHHAEEYYPQHHRERESSEDSDFNMMQCDEIDLDNLNESVI